MLPECDLMALIDVALCQEDLVDLGGNLVEIFKKDYHNNNDFSEFSFQLFLIERNAVPDAVHFHQIFKQFPSI